MIAGFWLRQVESKEEAIEWLKCAPFGGGTEVEIRQVFEAEDFGANLTPELREQGRAPARRDRREAIIFYASQATAIVRRRGFESLIMTTSDTHRAINAVWRIESAKLIAGLARFVRDVGLAEELAQDALVIAALYGALAELAPSPVVELNRAVALSMAFGSAAGLELVDALTGEPSLKSYHLLPSVRGDLLARLDRFDEARVEFESAATLTRNARERELLMERARICGND